MHERAPDDQRLGHAQGAGSQAAILRVEVAHSRRHAHARGRLLAQQVQGSEVVDQTSIDRLCRHLEEVPAATTALQLLQHSLVVGPHSRRHRAGLEVAIDRQPVAYSPSHGRMAANHPPRQRPLSLGGVGAPGLAGSAA
eukprot:8028943-Pyramimonas_sp.AAC.1